MLKKIWNAFRDDEGKEKRLRLADGGAWWDLFGVSSTSGKTVTAEYAMQLSAVWGCVTRTAAAVSSLPLDTYDGRGEASRTRVDIDRITTILRESPNSDQTAQEFWEMMTAWLLIDGNAYAEKSEFGGRLSALQPLPSNKTSVARDSDGNLVYRFVDRGKVEELPEDKILHIKGFSFGGDKGLSAIRYGANTFGSATATEEASAKIFANGMSASGVLSTSAVLKGDQRAQLQKIMEAYRGSSNAGKLMILESGLSYQQLVMNPEDAQMLETRRFNIEEICRWFGIPPVIIGHVSDGQTMWGSGVEAILLSWLTMGINPICRRIEARIKKQILRPYGHVNTYAEFNREALMQMDSNAKANYMSKMVQNGLFTRNEMRSKLNAPVMPGADVLTAQVNLAPLDQLGQKKK